MTLDAVKILIHSIEMSHLDYGNTLISGLSSNLIEMPQRVQNYASKIILQKRKSDSVMDCMRELHWLPCKKRSEFKALCMVYNSLHNSAPGYMSKLFHLKNWHGRNMRSKDNYKEIAVPYVSKKTFANRAISVFGAKAWNRLPNYIRQSENISIFKKKLKTFLFDEVYNNSDWECY